MPNTNINYSLEMDATVTALHHLIIQDEEIDYKKTQKSSTLYEGKIKNKFVGSAIYINLLVGGFAGEWSLKISVIELDNLGNETGDWKKLKTFPIKGNVQSSNQRKGRYAVNW
ncbi:hypothetical protein JW935_18600 [candidate division KSB1 bacterium]|nr:hypothetical protein [candidate division KSB1 bacterium]